MPISRRALFTLDFDRPSKVAGQWLRVHRTAMACRVEIALTQQDSRFVRAAGDALNEADRVEALLTVFRESSEVSRLNRDAGGEVGSEVFSLLQRCAELCADTDGAFDITSTPLSLCWGFLARQGRVPAQSDIEAARALVGMTRVTLDAATRSVSFERPGMALNLNAIGKGYALDQMASVLRRRGVGHALLSAGSSSVLALGGRHGGWPIDIRSPLVSRPRLARVRLRDGAVGTSGAGEQFVIANGTRFGHVIDPRTGWPAQGIISTSVITADAAAADALSTAFLIGGVDLARSYCSGHPGTLALLTVGDGTEPPHVYGKYPGAEIELEC
jgi:thiamine biosynthesis lipoprotein